MSEAKTMKELVNELKENPPWCLGCDKPYTLSISPLMWVCDCGDYRVINCAQCVWISTGWQDARGVGYCYSKDDYIKDENGTCEDWLESLRGEALAMPDAQSVKNIKMHDVGIKD